MRSPDELMAVKDSLRHVKADSSFELTILYALEVLERNKGNRTKTSEDLRIAVRTLRAWIKVMAAWGLDIPEYKYDPNIRAKKKTKYPNLKDYIKRKPRPL